MRKLFIALCVVLLSASLAFAGWVNGYYRSDGTYVRGHYRSSPDEYKSNNYGPSKNESDRLNPYGRDYDNDGIPNYQDYDDDNDGSHDDYDNNQYGR
jgi:hypothetical protein